MRYAFLWSQSALFCESMLSDPIQDVEKAFLDLSDPHFTQTRECDLTESHRFGPNLGKILDRYVYRNGIRGSGGEPLEIVCVDTTCGVRRERENPAEARAIIEYLRKEEPGDYAILTPYSHQIRTLKREIMGCGLPREEAREVADGRVLTVHRSQGREWDTVILSVQDNAGIIRPVPLRFTSSKLESGIKVINTAVSRAKRRLVIVCDRRFWTRQDDELIGALVSPENVSASYVYDADTGELTEGGS